MKAHLQNLTSHKAREMKPVIRWVLRELDVDRSDLVVRVKNSQWVQHSGRFYPHCRTQCPKVWAEVPGPSDARHLLLTKIPTLPLGRHDRKLRGGPPPIVPLSWKESLVCIVGHEAWHFREFLHPRRGESHVRRTKRGLVVVAPKLHSEVDAEWTEYRLLKRWRER